MKYPIRILIVEDSPHWRRSLYKSVLERFKAIPHYRDTNIDLAENGDQAMQLLRSQDSPYDLTFLDVNLDGETTGAPGPNGLDLLKEIGRRNAAFFAVFVTGSATDRTLAERYGEEAAAVIQIGLQCEGANHFPPDRIRVVNKPATGSFEEQWSAVDTALDGVIKAFEYASAWRFVFRPLKNSEGWWQFRWDAGDYVRIADKAGLPELHYILASVDSADELSVVEMMTKVQDSIRRPRSGGGRHTGPQGREKKSCLVFGEVLQTIRGAWLKGEIDHASLSEFHEWLGTNQLAKIGETLRKQRQQEKRLNELVEEIEGIYKGATQDNRGLPGTVRLVPNPKGSALEDRDKNHDAKLNAFRQQRRRIAQLLTKVGLEPMWQHFREAIDCGNRNPGRCPYNPRLAVRWVLD
jgi:CheY-like chemotaxis protein